MPFPALSKLWLISTMLNFRPCWDNSTRYILQTHCLHFNLVLMPMEVTPVAGSCWKTNHLLWRHHQRSLPWGTATPWWDSPVLPRCHGTMLKPCTVFIPISTSQACLHPSSSILTRFQVCQPTGKQNLQPANSKQHGQQRSLTEKGGCIYKLELLSHSALPEILSKKKEITLPKGISTHTAVPGGGKAAPKAPSSVIFSYSKAGFSQHPSSMNKPPPPAMHSIPLAATSHLCLEHQHVKICSDLKRKATCRDCGRNVTSSQNLTPIINPSTTTNSQRQGKGLGESKKGKRESKKLPSETTYAQWGRQHFHPTFAVAISDVSMFSAWPISKQEHWRREERERESQEDEQEKTNNSTEGWEITYKLVPGFPSCPIDEQKKHLRQMVPI